MDLYDLFQKYIHENNNYYKITQKYKNLIVGIDHIAFRSLNKINRIEPDSHTLIQDDFFEFKKYNASARWFKTDNDIKRIFSSWYNGIDKDNNFNNEEKKLIDDLLNNKINLSYDDFLFIHDKNQYLAWQLVNKNKINHIAYEVTDIYDITNKLINDGHKMNEVNGSIYNIGLNGKLIQTSIISNKILYEFDNNIVKEVTGSFIEFVQRIDNIEGFDNENANNIAVSTSIYDSDYMDL